MSAEVGARSSTMRALTDGKVHADFLAVEENAIHLISGIFGILKVSDGNHRHRHDNRFIVTDYNQLFSRETHCTFENECGNRNDNSPQHGRK